MKANPVNFGKVMLIFGIQTTIPNGPHLIGPILPSLTVWSYLTGDNRVCGIKGHQLSQFVVEEDAKETSKRGRMIARFNNCHYYCCCPVAVSYAMYGRVRAIRKSNVWDDDTP